MKNPRTRSILRTILGAFLILAGINHFMQPAMYAPMIPDLFSKEPTNFAAGLVELLLGIGVFIPRIRSTATLGILLLMIAFLPLHVRDVFRDDPAIGSKAFAYTRLPLQFVLIAWAWLVYRQPRRP